MMLCIVVCNLSTPGQWLPEAAGVGVAEDIEVCFSTLTSGNTEPQPKASGSCIRRGDARDLRTSVAMVHGYDGSISAAGDLGNLPRLSAR